MKIIIAGAGSVGRYMAEELSKLGMTYSLWTMMQKQFLALSLATHG